MGFDRTANARSPRGVDTTTLRITEIFKSLQGESSTVGFPTVFVRTTGCPLRCHYCDTAYAFSGGRLMPLDAVVAEVESHGIRHVTVTGGEPLVQPAAPALLAELCDRGLRVSLETSGALNVSSIDSRVMKVIDIKTPGSGEMERNLWSNLEHLTAGDQLKFVITDRDDYEWSRAQLDSIGGRAEVLFSPSHEEVSARELADWIVADALPVRFQLQLHKALWGDEPGR